jgi:hypothetical protein
LDHIGSVVGSDEGVMWLFLRGILLIANALALVFLVHAFIADFLFSHQSPNLKTLVSIGLMCMFALNIVFLFRDKDRFWPIFRFSNWRVFRLIGLWFDAKESELRKRAQDK